MHANSKAYESARIRELYSYHQLDTEADGIFDEITRLACYICNVPIAAISLVDEKRQWFKSLQGLDIKETSRDLAFCSYTIEQNDIMMVEDTLSDPTFDKHPLVTGEPHIRFYAGVPLTGENGYNIGSLCVIDRRKNKLTNEQKKALQSLANITMQIFELKKINQPDSHNDIYQKFEKLSLREKEVLKYFIIGHSIKEISQTLNLSPKTISRHLDNICQDMQCSNKHQLRLLVLTSGYFKSLIS